MHDKQAAKQCDFDSRRLRRSRFGGLLWGNLMVGLLLRIADRPNPREITRRARDAAAAFLRLYPQPDEAETARPPSAGNSG